MKDLKKYMHIYITTVSMIAFLTGWSFLAHSPTTVTPLTSSTNTQTITSASPLLGIQNLFSVTPASNSSTSSTSSTTLRTSGS